MSKLDDLPTQTPIQLIGEHAIAYLRLQRASKDLKATGEAHQRATAEYREALGVFSACMEREAG